MIRNWFEYRPKAEKWFGLWVGLICLFTITFPTSIYFSVVFPMRVWFPIMVGWGLVIAFCNMMCCRCHHPNSRGDF
jgi:hypothetical protein